MTPNKQGRKNSNSKKPKTNIVSTSSNSSIVKQAMQPKIFEVPSYLKESNERPVFKNTAIQRLSSKNSRKNKRSMTALGACSNFKNENDILEKLHLK